MKESEIIAGCRAREVKAQKAFVEYYSEFLFSICQRYVGESSFAKDCLQESLVHILNNVEKYEDRGKFKSWIASVTVRKCLDWIKKEKKRRNSQLDDVSEPFENEQVSYKLEHDDVMKFMETIPENYRIVINMFLIEGYNHKEIAEYMEVSESTSRSLLSRARKMVREKFESEKMFIIHKNLKDQKSIL